MNIIVFLKWIVEGVLFGILGIFYLFFCILCAIIIFPFCSPTYTFKAEDKWFAWHPVLLEDEIDWKLSKLRWLVFVKRGYNDDLYNTVNYSEWK